MEPTKIKSARVKFGKFANKGDKVAIIGTVKELVQQEGNSIVHLTVEDSKGMPIVIAAELCELVASPRP